MVSDKILAEQISMKMGRGYWEVNKKLFFDKSECLRYASKTKQTQFIRYSFFDSAFKSLDWNKEPTETLDELYRLRAQQLRDKYDYLILCFSGGADSTNILNTFLKNNIRLDEIICFYPLSAIDKLIANFNKNDKHSDNLIFEYTEAALPKLKDVANKHPNIKITVKDFTHKSIELVGGSSIDKVFLSGYAVNPTLAGQYVLAETIRERTDNNQKVAAICGLDKPRLLYNTKTKKFGAMFHDFLNFWGNMIIEDFEATTECFYITPDMPTITQKQSFELKRNIISRIDLASLSKMPDMGWFKGDTFVFEPHNDFSKHILYSDFDPSIWQANKTDNFFYMQQGSWFTKTNLTDTKMKDFYDAQVLELIHGIDKSMIEYKNGKPAMFKNFFSAPIWF